MNNKLIAKNLIKKRGNLTQEEVASKLGVTTAAVRHYEGGTRMPKDLYKYRLAKIYNCTVEELFYKDIFFENDLEGESM